MMSESRKEIDVALLSVDTENFRIGEQESTRDAYRAMIDDEGEDLANLADDIIRIGLSPAELLIVCPDPDKPDQFVVCEGNRRLTAIRLMENPALAAETPLHRKFVGLAKEYAKSPIKKLSCVVMPDKDAAFQWIERKHLDLGGRGIAKWGATAKANAEAFHGRVRASKAVVDHLKDRGLLPIALEESLRRKTTNLDRVFQMPYMRDALGVSVGKDGSIQYASGDQKRGDRLLKQMVQRMADKGFTVNQIRSADERKDFIDEFSSAAVLASPDGEASGGRHEKAAKKTAKKSARRASSVRDRRCLALKGKEHSLFITEPRLNALYDEACCLNPEIVPNSAAILTRVFIELTTDHFLTQRKVAIPAAFNKGRKRWSEPGIPLKAKVQAALTELDPSGRDANFKAVRQALGSSDAIHSVESLHHLVHHLEAHPDPGEIKLVWTRWHSYFRAIFVALN